MLLMLGEVWQHHLAPATRQRPAGRQQQNRELPLVMLEVCLLSSRKVVASGVYLCTGLTWILVTHSSICWGIGHVEAATQNSSMTSSLRCSTAGLASDPSNSGAARKQLG